MKKIMKSSALIAAMALGSASFAQLQDEQDVTMTMDLQPILQLSMEGPNQIDFTFDEINKYYTGVIKTGANILRVSASVSFDLWAVGVSTGQRGTLLWDNQVDYGAAIGATAINNIPLTALELHQWPANPVTTASCAAYTTTDGDYSAQFSPYVVASNSISGGNNAIYCANPAGAYLPPASSATGANTEKYIAGASGTTTGCQVNAGSYLFGSVTNSIPGNVSTNISGTTSSNGNQGTTGSGNLSGYYFVMDYRILPGLPAQFPAEKPANETNGGLATGSITLADAETTLSTAGNYAAPGVYTMFVKYILAEDQ